MLGNNSLSGELPLWTGFPKAQLFGLSNNDLDGVLPDRWAFPELSQLQVCLVAEHAPTSCLLGTRLSMLGTCDGAWHCGGLDQLCSALCVNHSGMTPSRKHRSLQARSEPASHLHWCWCSWRATALRAACQAPGWIICLT